MKSNIVLIICLLLFMTSCSDYLTEKTYDFVQPGSISDSDQGVDLWVTGAYNSAYFTAYDYLPVAWELDADYSTGPTWKFLAIGEGDFQGDHTLEYVWKVPYQTIAYANGAILGINAMKNATVAKKNDGLGELYFLQAWSYFSLVRDFGAVPIYLPGDDLAKAHGRRSVASVYAHIIDLLLKAEDLMYKNSDTGFIPGRASAGAAASLLSKVYLTMASSAKSGVSITIKDGPAMDNTITTDNKYTVVGKPVVVTKSAPVAGYESIDPATYFAQARDKALQVINGTYGTYTLFANWDDIWQVKNKNLGENIWSFQSTDQIATYASKIPGYSSGVWSSNNLTINQGAISGGYSTISYPTWGCDYHWYSLFEDKDIRIVNGVIHSYQTGSTSTSNLWASYYPTDLNWQAKKTAKTAPWFTLPIVTSYAKASVSCAGLTKTFYRTNRTSSVCELVYPLIRLSDVYLIYAEAKNETDGPKSDALTYLNMVRNRSNATSYSTDGSTSFSVSTTDDFRSVVIEERARELAFEVGNRRYDLLRWGLYLDAMNSFNGLDENGLIKTRSSKHLLYPIPSVEMISNDSITENNPGWK